MGFCIRLIRGFFAGASTRPLYYNNDKVKPLQSQLKSTKLQRSGDFFRCTSEQMIRIKTEEVHRLMVIRELRSRADLARESGIIAQHLGQVLNGHTLPNLSTVEKLCTALRCEPADIIEFRPAEPPAEPTPELSR